MSLNTLRRELLFDEEARCRMTQRMKGGRHNAATTHDSGFEVVAGEGLEPPTPGL